MWPIYTWKILFNWLLQFLDLCTDKNHNSCSYAFLIWDSERSFQFPHSNSIFISQINVFLITISRFISHAPENSQMKSNFYFSTTKKGQSRRDLPDPQPAFNYDWLLVVCKFKASLIKSKFKNYDFFSRKVHMNGKIEDSFDRTHFSSIDHHNLNFVFHDHEI